MHLDYLFYILIVAIGIHKSFAIIGKHEFNGYKVYELTPKSPSALDRILSEIDVDNNDMDVMKRSRFKGDTTDILISPEKAAQLEKVAHKYKIPIRRTMSNFGKSLDSSEHNTRRSGRDSSDPYRYRSYGEMEDFIHNISKTYSKCVRTVTIGNSYENRSLHMVKISEDPSEGRPIILVDALIHAREWVSGAMALYLIQQLAEHCNSGSELSKVDWYIIPAVNPDGYEYSRKNRKTRLWRKTMSKQNHAYCLGADGNRNFNYKWAKPKGPSSICSETYPGKKAFSETETRTVRTAMTRYKKRIKLYISLHSYGNYLVYPWGFTDDFLPKTWRKLDKMARSVDDEIRGAGGKPLKIMSAGQWYPAAGGSDDFALGAMGIPYSFTFELTDGYGFRFPSDEMEAYFPKIFKGFERFGKNIVTEFVITDDSC